MCVWREESEGRKVCVCGGRRVRGLGMRLAETYL